MKSSRARALRYTAGFFLALIPLSNLFNAFSNSAGPASFHETAAAQSAPKAARLDRPAATGAAARREALTGRFSLLARRAAAASPFAASLSATKSDALFTDVNGDLTADAGDTLQYTVTITNSGDMPATGVLFTDTIDPNTTLVPGSINTTPLAANDAFNALGNVQISINAPGLLGNDGDGDGDTVSVQSAPASSAQGGQLSVNANGAFTYNPPAGFEGTDTFTYTITDGNGGTDTATVTITVNEVIWFIDDSAAGGGDGRFTSPFDSLSDLGPAADDPGDFIFLYSGAYTGPHTLQNDQKLIGQGVDLASALLVPVPAGSGPLPGAGVAPTITSASNGIILAQNNRLSGFTVGNTGGTDIAGNNFGSLSVSSVRLEGTGQGVNLVNGILAATFTHISSSGAANGIFIKNTTGAFSVAGSGGAGTGGTIASTTGADTTTDGIGVYLENVTTISLQGMQINDHPNFAIRGINVDGFTLTNSVVNGSNGTSGASDESSIAFDNLTGSATISDSQISGGRKDNVRVTNSAGTLDRITFDTVTIGANSNGDGNDGIFLHALNSAVLKATVQNSFLTSTRGDHLQFNLNNTAAGDLDFINNAITNNHTATIAGGGGVAITGGGGGSNVALTYEVSGNSFRDSRGTALFVGLQTGTGSFNGIISNNTIGDAGIPNSGSSEGGAIEVRLVGGGSSIVGITNNVLAQYNNNAIHIQGGDASAGGNGSINATVTGNTISNPGNLSGLILNGLHLNWGTSSGDAHQACLSIGGAGGLANSLTGSGANGGTDFRLRQRMATTVRLPGYAGANNDNAAVVAFVQGNNGGTPTGSVANSVPTGGGYVGGTACTAPSGASLDEVIAAAANRQSAASMVEAIIRDVLLAPEDEGAGAGAYILTQSDLGPMIQAAIERWKAAGVEGDDLAKLEALKIEIAKLPAGQLVVTTPDAIIIDESASNFGWFIDSTPGDESEFESKNGLLRANPSSAAAGRMDLLSALTRAMGFALEHADIERASYSHWYRANTLIPSMRRVPSFKIEIPAPVRQYPLPSRGGNQLSLTPGKAGSQPVVALAIPARAAIFNPAEFDLKAAASKTAFTPMSGETITRNVGTIPAGKSVSITFRVTINDPLPQGVCEVVNQGAVLGDGGINILTDDPDTAAPGDATRTSLPEAPAITCPDNITVNAESGQCSAVVTFSTTSTGCPAPTVTCTPASGSTFTVGTTTVNCTASNGSGPDATCSFTVTVNDTQPPAISCPDNISVQATGTCEVVNYTTPMASDNCPGATVSCEPASGTCFPTGTTTVTCTATDASNNTASCTFTVHVMAVCTITCPADILVGNSPGQCGAFVNYQAPTTIGGCGSVICTPASGSFFPKGTTAVHCSTATGATCSFTVTVIDTEPPTITCPANISVTAPDGQTSTVVNYEGATATDNCPGVTVVCIPPSGSAFPLGRTTVTCTATDASGNMSSCSFRVAVSGAILASADSFLRNGANSTNEGANERLRIQNSGNNRAVVRFDLSGISMDGLQSATLVLDIAENQNNWGSEGRPVDAHRLLADWTEGNGRNDIMVGGGPNFRGTGEGVTWECAKDANINNTIADCLSEWNGGIYAAATSLSATHTNNQTGSVNWNVTADVQAGADFGWLIRKTSEGQNGQVRYYSREGAALAGNPNLAPRLVLVYAP